jgi:hypothetical protein
MHKMLVPESWSGTVDQIKNQDISWLKNLPKNTYCDLWLRWPDHDLPCGYELYVVSFHLEVIDIEWITEQAQKTSAPIIVLSDLNYYNYPFPKNVYLYTYYYWHRQTDLIKKLFPNKVEKQLTFKASAFCNRITQSKMIVFTALAEYLGDQALLKLDDWLEEKNVHYRNNTGIKKLDNIADLFWSKYFGKKYAIDQFNNNIDNIQTKTSDPWSRAYQECVFNFTNESFHYSYMINNGQQFIHPGPFLSEKTLKCLVGATPFVAVGQFDTYASLINLGFKFDYGNLDLSWDRDSGNLSRLSSLVDVIINFQQYSINDLFEMSKDSTEHNFNHIWSNNFYNNCELINERTVETIIAKHT